MAVHAHGAEGARRAIRAGARSVEHGSMLDRDTVAMLADSGTYLGVDLFDGEWALAEGNAVGWPADTMRKLRETMDTGIAAFRWAVEAGVRITYSTDSGVYPHELVAKQFDTYVRLRDDAAGGDPLRDRDGGGVPGLGGPGGDAAARAVRGPRGGRRGSRWRTCACSRPRWRS